MCKCKEEKKDRKNVRRNNGSEFPQHDKNSKLLDPRRSYKTKHNEYEENYTKVQQNQIA